jgi:hypothetical protein
MHSFDFKSQEKIQLPNYDFDYAKNHLRSFTLKLLGDLK